MIEECEVAVVGGGPAGAAVAALLAQRGRSVTVLEARPAYRWHACGVFSGPAIRPLLRSLGIGDAELRAVARVVPAMRLETPGGSVVRLTYGADRGGSSALGFDRRALDELLLERAAQRGACVSRGAVVERVDLDASTPSLTVRAADGTHLTVRPRVVVGADGIRSTVARAAGVARRPRIERIGVTFHVVEAPFERSDDGPDPEVDARMVVLGDAYVGLAPVPGRRVNVGIVLRGRNAAHLRAHGVAATAKDVLAGVTDGPGSAVRLADSGPLDRPAGAAPLGHRVTRRAGRGWVLIGDAAGFLDPFTGEGLHRALVSATLAARAIGRELDGVPRALEDYDRAMRGRFVAKDVVSLIVQAFVARPALLEYAARRLAARQDVRRTLELALADLAPATRALDPRFLAALLAP
ncbi:MAG TPA: NAD(P)/FAD-dependent oxidoreductase [Candidatus Limnocylindrales bacterium]|nr:NAD(P)/FAD-dependent oxidoreductase [Candidatus Limnocylindrales bacterium]